MSQVQKFEDLTIWQKAREVVQHIYKCSQSGEFGRDFAFRDQMRRAAVSVMANIAEGFERDGNKEFVQFLAQAKASCGELRSHAYVAEDLGYLSPEIIGDLNHRVLELSRMISSLISYLRQSEKRGRKFS